MLDLNMVMQLALQRAQTQAQAQGVELQPALVPYPLLIQAEEESLHQMTMHLISNALQFTPSGGRVVLRTELDAMEYLARLCVEDNGPGIPPEVLPRLFDRLYQVGTGREGSGLGLELVRRVAETFGGSIKVTSPPGTGARFCVSFPCTGPRWRAPNAPNGAPGNRSGRFS
ncbi:MAG: ATP-binding protein [Anaerolineae bacterium]|nr:ATP-binding protein [Anaerolineae bacterium]